MVCYVLSLLFFIGSFLDTEEDVDDIMNATLNDARPTLGSTLADKSWQLYRHFLYQVSYKYADVHKRYEGRPFRVRSWYLCKGIPTHGCYDTLARHSWTREFGHGHFAFM